MTWYCCLLVHKNYVRSSYPNYILLSARRNYRLYRLSNYLFITQRVQHNTMKCSRDKNKCSTQCKTHWILRVDCLFKCRPYCKLNNIHCTAQGPIKPLFVSLRTSCCELRTSCSGRKDKRILWSFRTLTWTLPRFLLKYSKWVSKSHKVPPTQNAPKLTIFR